MRRVVENVQNADAGRIGNAGQAGERGDVHVQARTVRILVIGKQGHTIEAIRNLLNAAASRHGQKVVLQILEEKGEVVPTPAPAEA